MRSCRYLTLCTGLLVCCVDPGKPTNPVAARIAVSPPAVELLNGASTTLHAALLSWSGDTVHDAETVVWTVRDSSLASVSSRGVVSASWALTGSTYVIARAGAFSDSVSVLVVGALPQGDPLYLWPDVSTIVPGMTRTLRLESFTTANGIRFFTGQAKWTSSDPAVASVDSTGIVTAHAVGDASITAAASGQLVGATIHVMSYPAPLQFTSVSVGDLFACGLTATGQAYCWGSNLGGRLGTTAVMDKCESEGLTTPPGSTRTRTTYPCSGIPRLVNIGESVTEVHAAFGGACALTASSNAVCWGSEYGLTGALPTIRAGTKFRSLSLGTQGCGIGVDGKVYCWSTGDATPVDNRTDWQTVSSRLNGICALDGTGQPFCWGRPPVTGAPGHVADSIVSPSPVVVDARYAGVRFSSVVATGGTNCGLAIDGQLYCWGGDETNTDGRALGVTPAVPQVSGGFVAISAPLDGRPGHLRPICALTKAGDAYCVQYNQTAPADSAFPSTPLAVGIPLKALSYRGTACAVGLDGYAYCWGAGSGEPTMAGTGLVHKSELTGVGVPRRVIGQK